VERVGQVIKNFDGSDVHKQAGKSVDPWYEAAWRSYWIFIAYFATKNCDLITFRNENFGYGAAQSINVPGGDVAPHR
jgi:hypothetical protein